MHAHANERFHSSLSVFKGLNCWIHHRDRIARSVGCPYLIRLASATATSIMRLYTSGTGFALSCGRRLGPAAAATRLRFVLDESTCTEAIPASEMPYARQHALSLTCHGTDLNVGRLISREAEVETLSMDMSCWSRRRVPVCSAFQQLQSR